MRRISSTLLAVGLALGGLLGGCDQGVGTQAGADMRDAQDLRTSAGNEVIGQVCDENRACPMDPKGTGPARCATIVELDRVGACVPTCTSNLDCDTVLPGVSFCTGMMSAGKSECVVFCDVDKRVSGLECPQGWTCVPAQGYKVCRPPQNGQ